MSWQRASSQCGYSGVSIVVRLEKLILSSTGHSRIPEARFKLGSFWTNGLGGDYDALDSES